MTRRRAHGFTLIEVVVAFAILALSLGVLYEVFGGALRRSAAASNAELATLRAESLLAEFRGSAGLLPQPRSGRDDSGLEWRISTRAYPAEVEAHSAWQADAVTVDVSWGRAAPRTVTLRSVELTRRERR